MRFSIVYFSAAGHTLKVIRHIAEQMGGIDRAVDLSDPFLKQTSFAKDAGSRAQAATRSGTIGRGSHGAV